MYKCAEVKVLKKSTVFFGNEYDPIYKCVEVEVLEKSAVLFGNEYDLCTKDVA